MPDYMDFIKNLKKSAESASVPRKSGSSIFDLCGFNNLGNVLLRIIPDNNGIAMKTLNRVFEVKEKEYTKNENGEPEYFENGERKYRNIRYTIASPENYNAKDFKLNPEQEATLNKCIETLNKYSEYASQELFNDPIFTVKYRKSLIIFWGKIFSAYGLDKKKLDITEGDIKLFRHSNADRFLTAFNEGMDAITDIKHDGGLWFSKHMCREPGTYNQVTSISTKLNDGSIIGYSSTVGFSDGADYELTQEDLDRPDLNTQIVDITRFDETAIKNITKKLQDAIDEVDKNMTVDKSKQPSSEDQLPVNTL